MHRSTKSYNLIVVITLMTGTNSPLSVWTAILIFTLRYLHSWRQQILDNVGNCLSKSIPQMLVVQSWIHNSQGVSSLQVESHNFPTKINKNPWNIKLLSYDGKWYLLSDVVFHPRTVTLRHFEKSQSSSLWYSSIKLTNTENSWKILLLTQKIKH